MDNHDLNTGEQKSQLYEMLVPPLAAWVLYFLLGALVLLVVNIHSLVQFAATHIIGSPEAVGIVSYSDILAPVFNFTNKLNTPLLMLFWGIIGMLTYFIVSIFEQVFSIITWEVRRSKYLQGGILPVRDYWKSSLKSYSFFTVLLISWSIFFIFYVQAALPWLSKLLVSGIYYQLSPIILLLEIMGSLIGNMLCIYLFLVLSTVLHNFWVSVRS